MVKLSKFLANWTLLNFIYIYIYIYQNRPHKYVNIFIVNQWSPLFFCEFGCLIAVHILAETEHIYLIGNIFLINKFHFVISSLRNATEISYSIDMKTRWKKKGQKLYLMNRKTSWQKLSTIPSLNDNIWVPGLSGCWKCHGPLNLNNMNHTTY